MSRGNGKVRKYDHGYSFQASEVLSTRDRKQSRRPPGEPLPDLAPAGSVPCARGQWCATSVTAFEGGEEKQVPSLGPRNFCDRDRAFVARCLEELPEQYVRLVTELGSPSQGGIPVRIPFGPRVPLRVDIDALLRAMAESLVSWHERVADVARLSFPEGRLAVMRRESVAVGRSVAVLSAHLDALLALEAAPMSRAWSPRDLDALPDGADGVIRSAGYADVTLDLSGADAGLEIIHLRHLARATLGETRARPEELTGVPCRDPDGTCGWRSVYRAELPSDPDAPVWWTECARCGDRMDEKTYREWVALCAAYERHRRREPAILENLPGVA